MKAKIGLLTGGYYEYWPMYDNLKEQVEGYTELFTQMFVDSAKNDDVEIICSGLADTLEKCNDAGQMFKDQQIDLLVIAEMTYFPDYMPVQVMEYLKDVPVVLLWTQPTDSIPLDMDYKMSIVHGFGPVGIFQLSGCMKKMKKKFEIFVGALNDISLCEKVLDYLNVVMTVKKLRYINLGIIGHTFQGMYDLEIDKTMLKSKLGPNVIYIEMAELLEEWRKVNKAKSQEACDTIYSKYKVDGPGQGDVFNACRLSVAMESIAEKYNLSGLSHLCQHLLHVETETTPCLANAKLVNKGVMVTCEGDIGNLVTMCIMHMISHSPVYNGEWGMYHAETNSIVVFHHGAGTPELAESDQKVTITPTGEKWGFKGTGASVRYVAKPGVVTMTSLIYKPEGWEMFIARGEIIDVPERPYWGCQYNIKVEIPVKEYIEKLCKQGVTHHVIVTYGDFTKQLVQLTELIDIKAVTVL